MALGEVHPGQAEVELAAEEGDGSVVLRGQLLEELLAEVEDGGLVGSGGGGVERGHGRRRYLTRRSSVTRRSERAAQRAAGAGAARSAARRRDAQFRRARRRARPRSRSSAERLEHRGALVEAARRAEQHAELAALLGGGARAAARRSPSTQHSACAIAGSPVGAGQVGRARGRRSPAATSGRGSASSHGTPALHPLEERLAALARRARGRRRRRRGSGRGSADRAHEEVPGHPDALHARRRSAGPTSMVSTRQADRDAEPPVEHVGEERVRGGRSRWRGRRRSPSSSKRWWRSAVDGRLRRRRAASSSSRPARRRRRASGRRARRSSSSASSSGQRLVLAGDQRREARRSGRRPRAPRYRRLPCRHVPREPSPPPTPTSPP